METIFMNSENSKNSRLRVLILNLIDKTNLRRDEKSAALSNINIYYVRKNIKTHTRKKIIKYNKNNILDPSIRIYVNKTENTITFKTKTRCYLKSLRSETMKLLGSTENRITKDDSENVPHLEITQVIVVHCNIVNNDY